MELNEYQKKALETKVYGSGNDIIYPALGLTNEAGEVSGKIKKVLRDNNGVFNIENKRKIADELGDVLWYLAACAEDLGYSLNEIAEMNIDKLLSRRERGVIQGSGDNR